MRTMDRILTQKKMIWMIACLFMTSLACDNKKARPKGKGPSSEQIDSDSVTDDGKNRDVDSLFEDFQSNVSQSSAEEVLNLIMDSQLVLLEQRNLLSENTLAPEPELGRCLLFSNEIPSELPPGFTLNTGGSMVYSDADKTPEGCRDLFKNALPSVFSSDLPFFISFFSYSYFK